MGEAAKRALRVLAGSTLLVVGLLLLVLPGPGVLLLISALGLLARDVPAAARLQNRLKARVKLVANVRPRRGLVLVALLPVLALLIALI